MKIYILGWRHRHDDDVYLPCDSDGLIVCNISGKQCGGLESVILEFTYEDAEKAAGRWAKTDSYKIIELEV